MSYSETVNLLELSGLSFISSDYDSSQKFFSFIGATLRTNEKKPDMFMINLTGKYAVGNPVLSYLNIREVDIGFDVDETSKIFVGRKMMNWSELDSKWNMGLYQPQFRWNPIDSETQGLTGLFWQKKQTNFSMRLFASPLYIPDQGPGYELKDGQFQNSNPWFQAPPQNIKFQGQLLPIDYEVNKPETTDVINQTSYGASLSLGENQGFFANLSGSYKPANQLALAYKGVLVTTRVRIDILPKVYYENIYSADVGFRDSWGQVLFSIIQTNPHNPSFDVGYNVPVFQDSLSWGPQIVYNFKPFQFSLAYLDTSGGEVKEEGPDASPDRASLSQRFLFRQAIQLEVKYKEVYMRKLKLESSVQWRESSKDQFKQLRLKNKLVWRGPWSCWVDVLLIETDDNATSNMAPYRNLDQSWIGVSYDI